MRVRSVDLRIFSLQYTNTNELPVSKDIKQDDIISSKLLNVALKDVLKELKSGFKL